MIFIGDRPEWVWVLSGLVDIFSIISCGHNVHERRRRGPTGDDVCGRVRVSSLKVKQISCVSPDLSVFTLV